MMGPHGDFAPAVVKSWFKRQAVYVVFLVHGGKKVYIQNDDDDYIRPALRFNNGDLVWAKMDEGWVEGTITRLYGNFGKSAYRVQLKTGLDVWAPIDDSTYVKRRKARVKSTLRVGASESDDLELDDEDLDLDIDVDLDADGDDVDADDADVDVDVDVDVDIHEDSDNANVNVDPSGLDADVDVDVGVEVDNDNDGEGSNIEEDEEEHGLLEDVYGDDDEYDEGGGGLG